VTAPIDTVRAQFPSLAVADEGRARIYFDNPAGTQVPQQVIDRTVGYYTNINANSGGAFVTSRESVAMIVETRRKLAAFFNAADADEIVIGQAMTALTFHMTRALEPIFQPGDEILVTQMDHDGNVTPWLRLAERLGLTVKWLPFDPETARYDLAALDTLLTPRTRLAAINYASNITGTINDVAAIAKRVKAVGGLTYVDAVQYAPHGVIDVQTLGVDFLVCSAYKFYGPHLGILWGRRELLERFHPPKLRAAPEAIPHRYMMGAPQFESIAGLGGALDYYVWLGGEIASDADRAAATHPMNAAKLWMQRHEEALAARLIAGLQNFKGVTIHGLTGANEMSGRVSTVSATFAGHDPAALATALAGRNIFTWSGHNYALDVIDRLGLKDKGGVLRFGPVHYNTAAEVDETLAALDRFVQ
jgi:cysteine desulfurase family protein (TIGR01976 family)